MGAIWGNRERLLKEPAADVDPILYRFKRGWIKQNDVKYWAEIDELALRLFTNAKVCFSFLLIPPFTHSFLI